MPIWESIKTFLGLAGLHDRDEDVLIAQIESVYNRDRQRVETLTLTEYVDFLSDVPLPSAQQRNELLSLFRRLTVGTNICPRTCQPFYFFIDKYAGGDRLRATLVSRFSRPGQKFVAPIGREIVKVPGSTYMRLPGVSRGRSPFSDRVHIRWDKDIGYEGFK